MKIVQLEWVLGGPCYVLASSIVDVRDRDEGVGSIVITAQGQQLHVKQCTEEVRLRRESAREVQS